MKKRALVSVSDKTGIIPFVQKLEALGVEIISTGGTKNALAEAGVKVIGIEEVTQFPEMMDGRVKTLHPNIHGGLLARRDLESHMEAAKEHGIEMIDYVIVNLYPFQQTIENPESTFADAIENIDIGGPSMIRSAAKNHASVAIIVDAADYDVLAEELAANGELSEDTKRKLAAKAFRHTAAYDALIAEYLTKQVGEETPEKLTVTYNLKQTLRYGENPHQKASFYEKPLGNPTSVARATQLHGKELSYNNINDADAALAVIRDFVEPAVCAVKHMNPCGVGVGETVYDAYMKAFEADPVSIFGGIVASNRTVDAATAEKMSGIFLEIVIAPSFTEEALEILTQKKNIRLLTVEMDVTGQPVEQYVKSVAGGALLQDEDTLSFEDVEIKVATKREPTEDELKQLKMAWKVVKHVKSNAIVLGKADQTIGIGAGQMNRVGAAKIALEQAGDQAVGAVLASDAFFPMNDTVEAAAKAGITAIIQPGGSVKDQDSIDKADEYGIAMVFTGVRHFKH
ncbi:bifunctional phosphoribosylaminoimidazolecarboxamide formyltransferase/IMP cyclohydrolase [Evansella sp. AB-rgal1]|uniref:bifunctional phosphoribosylaminoimidazolecarboxamide formyltransferase/IMP cyclohydrolase n=1 Tax=Evansella sp. AB-rgal1 TaxID=3242696 RepID=UPI00359CFEC0